jgi:hypothetical protein
MLLNKEDVQLQNSLLNHNNVSTIDLRTVNQLHEKAFNAENFHDNAPDLLLHELQLENSLGLCIQQARRSDFSLMLAMLCDDVREQSQFYLPTNEQQADKQFDDLTLRNMLELPEAAPLALNELSTIPSFNQANLVEAEQFASLRLINTLSPKPIAFRDNNKFICEDVLSNTSLVCQQKYHQTLEDSSEGNQQSEISLGVTPVLNKRSSIDAVKWLKCIQSMH